MAGEYSQWVIRKGNTFNPYIIIKQDGTVVNLAGYAVTWTFYNKEGGTAVFSLTEGSGVTVTDVEGKIQVTLTDEQTATIAQPVLFYRVDLENGGAVSTYLYGNVAVIG